MNFLVQIQRLCYLNADFAYEFYVFWRSGDPLPLGKINHVKMGYSFKAKRPIGKSPYDACPSIGLLS